MQLSENSMLAN